MSDKIEYKFWLYTPSVIGGAVGAGVFGLLTTLHIFRLIRNRTWFCIPLIVGGIFETIGYAARAAAHYDTKTKPPYIIQSVLILIAPILFAASIYMILGRLIMRTHSASLSLVPPTWVTIIFVAGDIISFFVQAGGAGMLVQAKTQKAVQRGEYIILGGLILQIGIFMIFVIVAGTWHRKLDRRPTAASSEINWHKYITLLYGASALITIRNTCRVVEYALGRDGYLLNHEWTLYAYDFIPMVLTLAVCIFWYDPNIKPHAKRDVEMEMRQ
ncbi:RTA1 like protein [Lentithecium fluviatile CBS 122367]|uniref:RTA1 like protein n=1 Tax=Lentithecium fluviatile CBS 122367 TaxID=1168545 RepID=A0A6G1J0D6_9PLEO|nr:RTA1 like protein [Lentithecium fluviatile CBS 122367]